MLSGKITAGKAVIAAVQRYRSDLETAGDRGWIFDTQIANDTLDGWPLLFQHTTGEYAGTPFIPYPFQAFLLWNVFGWRSKETGFRRFRDVFFSVARGNGKSPFGASILLNLFAADIPIESRSECYCVATMRDQAKIVFGECARFVERNKALQPLISVYKHELKIHSDDSILRPLASDSKNLDGLVIHGVIRDELHAWRPQHREMLEKLDTAMGKRRQPLAVTITTAGNDESEIWDEAYQFSSAVATQALEADTHFSLIYEIDEDDNPLDPAVWAKANPMLEFGVVKQGYLDSAAKKAQNAPEGLLSFKRYHGNRYVSSATKVISREAWALGNEPLPPLDGQRCYIGFDWGWRDDLAALARVFPLDEVKVGDQYRRRYAIECDAWVPRECKRDLQREPWASWIRSGLLRVTEGDTTDVDAIYEHTHRLTKRYEIGSVAFDPNNAREFSTRCANDWGLQTFPFLQAAKKYNEPLREFLAALREGRIIHGGNQLLGWCAQNLTVKEDEAGYWMPSKRRSRDKIDPIVAVLMALSECMFADRPSRSVYEDRGIVFL